MASVDPSNDILTEEEHRYVFEKGGCHPEVSLINSSLCVSEMQAQAAKAVQEGGAKEVHCGACGRNFVSM